MQLTGPDLTWHWSGIAVLLVFVAAYAVVIAEEFTHLRKSKPVMLAAGVIWAVVGWQVARTGDTESVGLALEHFVFEFSEVFLFLLVAMTYVNAMSNRNVFEALRSWLTARAFTYRQLFWITGVIAFLLSPLIDNMTTALVMSSVILAVGSDKPRFVSMACVNIVVAANAGGAFSPFGDVTTLMVWQAGYVEFSAFFALFLPSVVNFLVPALVMSVFVEKGMPPPVLERQLLRRGARRVLLLFAATVTTAVLFHNVLHLPAFMGMMTGLAYLGLFGYFLRHSHGAADVDLGDVVPFDSFDAVARAEWDTLLFFFGVIMCVGGLGFVGYLEALSGYLYVGFSHTVANTAVGLLSAVVDNIPVMVAVLQMNPQMDLTQWLLVTLTAGVGGSLLSIGSAAGVATMGQARGYYTFFGHLKWTPAIAAGFALSIWVHLLIN